MKNRWKSILAAFFATSIVMLAGVLLFFNPIAKMDSTSGPLVPPAVNFFVYMILSIWFFDWVAHQIRNAYKAAFIIATSQFILVNIDYVLSGKRGLMTAGASTLLLILTWGCAAIAYSYFTRFKDHRTTKKPGEKTDTLQPHQEDRTRSGV